jgi:transposase
MISKEDFIVIHALYNKGNSISEIARLTKLDRKTVRKRLQEITLVPTSRLVKRPSKLEPFKAHISEFIAKSEYRIPSSVILKDIKALGYQGGRSILQDYLTQEYRKLNLAKQPLIRFETEPGEQMQVDWTTIRSGSNPIYGFVATLGYSRYSFVCFTDNMVAATLIKCHEQAFLYFGGVSQSILYDNMKTVVEKRNCYGRGQHKYHDELLDLAKRYGFKIKLCQPYRAQTKGKVERFNSYLKSNFYRPLAIKLKDAGLTITHHILNQYVSSWLKEANNRIHGTTNQQPSKLLTQEAIQLLPVGNSIAPSGNQEVIKPKSLPPTYVQQTNLSRYDQLLKGVAA